MMIDSMQMKNFRCFEELSLSLDKKYTVLIDTGSAGNALVVEHLPA